MHTWPEPELHADGSVGQHCVAGMQPVPHLTVPVGQLPAWAKSRASQHKLPFRAAQFANARWQRSSAHRCRCWDQGTCRCKTANLQDTPLQQRTARRHVYYQTECQIERGYDPPAAAPLLTAGASAAAAHLTGSALLAHSGVQKAALVSVYALAGTRKLGLGARFCARYRATCQPCGMPCSVPHTQMHACLKHCASLTAAAAIIGADLVRATAGGSSGIGLAARTAWDAGVAAGHLPCRAALCTSTGAGQSIPCCCMAGRVWSSR